MDQAISSAPMTELDRTPSPWGAWRVGEGFGLATEAWPGTDLFRQPQEYVIDAWQRSVLFLDMLRQRGNQHFEYTARQDPNVLIFQFEVVMDGRLLDRPVNFLLTRIIPPAGVEIDPRKRPFIVFDPRAGHGPGIGGMKHESEIGVALAAGHPCYFVSFLTAPMPGQTLEDVCRAEACFIEKVADLHADAEAKPCLVGNCQAGWQIMMTSAIRPDLPGPILLVGSPLSYWAGVHGGSPMRYLGGLLGGTWLTSLAGDLGHGIFDGANLVANFENLNPANTFWKKDYTVYSKVDTETPRFLEFEKWWGSPVLLNADEIQFITDELFVGNKLATGEICTPDGFRVDLRTIKSPIVVFCSWGDDITPPQQALDWILDLYDSDEEIAANGQTIVYALHENIGHLGIFVSAKVATKEHEEFAHSMDLIDLLPPGLYQAVFTEKCEKTAGADLVAGNYVVRFETRRLDDIRALGCNDAEDDLRFATLARLSEINQGLYRTVLSPWVRACTTGQSAEFLRHLHPHRLRFELFSDRNPLLRPLEQLAEGIRANRQPAASDNPFLTAQETVSDQIVKALDHYREVRDRMVETLFMTIYGSPLLQAMVGLRSDLATGRRHIGRDVAHEAATAKSIVALENAYETGGIVEAAIRGLLYIYLGQPTPAVDERAFAMMRQIRSEQPASRALPLARFKEIVREQYLLLLDNEDRAVAAIAKLLPSDPNQRADIIGCIRRIVSASDTAPEEVERRLKRVEALFTAETPALKILGMASAGRRLSDRAGAERRYKPIEPGE